jgi:signal transduction histidine kinase
MIDKLFPFHFVLDRAFKIVQKGSSLSKIISDSDNFDELFTFKTPSFGFQKSFDGIHSRPGQIFILESKGQDLLLQGQFVCNANQDLLFFCGNPWVKQEAALKAFNPEISDAAVQSTFVENDDFLKSSIEEVNERVVLNEVYEAQKNFFERLFDEIPVDMAIIDMDRRFKYLNKTAVKDDVLRRWMIGKTNIDYFSFKNFDIEIGYGREAVIQSAIDSNKTVWFEDVHYKNTEREVIMLRSVSPFIMHDGTKYLLGYGLDISEIKKNVKLIEQKNSALEKLNKELNSIIYAITHDFRSPILAVKGLVELLKISAELNPRLEGFLDFISASIKRLDDQIIDIYHFIKNAKIALKLSPVNLKELVLEIFALVEHIVPYQVNLILDIEEKAIFITDTYRLKIILNNLISNAVKYSSNRNNNAFVEIWSRVDEHSCNFYVKDNGEGIPDHLKDKVFEIYYRANNKTSGAGLGLFICNEAVRKLKGTIELETKLGQGSTFSVNLPNSKLVD